MVSQLKSCRTFYVRKRCGTLAGSWVQNPRVHKPASSRDHEPTKLTEPTVPVLSYNSHLRMQGKVAGEKQRTGSRRLEAVISVLIASMK